MDFKNPYIIGAPVHNEQQFFGQDDVMMNIRSSLFQEDIRSVILYGQRRIGKTSVLMRVRDTSPETHIPVYVDIARLSSKFQIDDLFFRLAESISETIGIEIPVEAEFRDQDASYFEMIFLKQTLQRLGEKKLLLIIDEFDSLNDHSHEVETRVVQGFLDSIYKLITEEPRICFLFAIGQRVEDLQKPFAALLKNCIFVKIGLLTREATNDLIQVPISALRRYDVQAVEEIWRLTSGHAYLTNFLCSVVFSNMRDSDAKIVTVQDVTRAVPTVLERAAAGLDWFWRGISHMGHFVLSALAEEEENQSGTDYQMIVEKLGKHKIHLPGLETEKNLIVLANLDVVAEGAAGYRFKVELMRRWVAFAHPLRKALYEAEVSNTRAYRILQNAQDLFNDGKFKEAIADYKQALAIHDLMPSAWLGLGVSYLEEHNYAEAINALEKAYQALPDHARDNYITARLNYGYTLKKDGRLDEARAQFVYILEHLDSQHQQARNKIVEIIKEQSGRFIEDGNWPDAWDMLEAASKEYDPAILQTIWWENAREFNLTNRPGDAISVYQFLIERGYETARCYAGIEQSRRVQQIAELGEESAQMTDDAMLLMDATYSSFVNTSHIDRINTISENLERPLLSPQRIRFDEFPEYEDRDDSGNTDVHSQSFADTAAHQATNTAHWTFRIVSLCLSGLLVALLYFGIDINQIIGALFAYEMLAYYCKILFWLVILLGTVFFLNKTFKIQTYRGYWVCWLWQFLFTAVVTASIFVIADLLKIAGIPFVIVWFSSLGTILVVFAYLSSNALNRNHLS